MARFEDLKIVLGGIEHYRETDVLPDNSMAVDNAAKRVLREDPFDRAALEWERISDYEREIQSSSWSEAS